MIQKLTSCADLNTRYLSSLNVVSQVPIVNQIIPAQKAIYNIFGSGIYYEPHFIYKSKSYEFHNRNITLLSRNDTRMAGYFIGMHRDLRMKKSLLATISSDEFSSI